MSTFIIIVIIVVIFIFYEPTMSESTGVYVPLPLLEVRNTLLFALIGMYYSQHIDPFPISNVFLGMISGSFLDLLLKKQK